MTDRWHDEGMHVPSSLLPSPFRQLRAHVMQLSSICMAGTLLASCSFVPSTSNDGKLVEPKQLKVSVIADHPWDSSSFTQGLEVEPTGDLLVSTGMYGQSRIYRSDLSGAQRDSQPLAADQFGEGLSRSGATVWQLTWKNGIAIKRNADSLEQVGTAQYGGEGWGLCAFPDRLVMSNGSGELTFRNPETFAQTSSLQVHKADGEVTMLNELECVLDGPLAGIWANVWQSNDIYQIDPQTGQVLAVADASGLLTADESSRADVLNGIAHIPGSDRMYLTGKYWPRMFEVAFSEQ